MNIVTVLKTVLTTYPVAYFLASKSIIKKYFFMILHINMVFICKYEGCPTKS